MASSTKIYEGKKQKDKGEKKKAHCSAGKKKKKRVDSKNLFKELIRSQMTYKNGWLRNVAVFKTFQNRFRFNSCPS